MRAMLHNFDLGKCATNRFWATCGEEFALVQAELMRAKESEIGRESTLCASRLATRTTERNLKSTTSRPTKKHVTCTAIS